MVKAVNRIIAEIRKAHIKGGKKAHIKGGKKGGN